MHRLLILLACLVVAFGAAAQPTDKDPRSADRALGGDRFTAGGSALVDQPVGGDLFVAGGKVEVRADVAGDLVATGGSVLIRAPVGQGVYAAGGELEVDGAVARNVRIAGGRIELGRAARVAGNLSAMGGRIELAGDVRGYVQIAGGQVRIDGPIGGDVEIAAGKVALGPNARIAGALRYTSEAALEADPAAQVAGGIERVGASQQRVGEREASRHRYTGGWIWTLGLIALAALLVYAVPGFYERVSTTARTHFGMSALLGFAALACIPVAAVIALVTIVGIPVGVLALLAYPIVLIVGYAGSAIALGDAALLRWRGNLGGSALRRAGAAALAMLIIAACARIPFVGGFVVFVAMIAGVGALTLQIRRRPTAVA